MQESVTRRPGRPKSEEKAAAIQQAAISLFMADGIERTSMDAIASEAGVSKQTVYSHFRNKDDLFRSCVAGKLEMYGLDVSSLETDDDIDVLLREAGRKYLELIGDPGVVRMFRLMAAEAETHRDTVRSFYESGPRATMRNVAEIVARHMPGAPDNIELAVRATDDYLALVRGTFFIEFLLGIRESIAENEMDAHLDRCILQLHELYDLT